MASPRAAKAVEFADLTPETLGRLFEPLRQNPAIGTPIAGGPARVALIQGYTIVYVWGTAESVVKLRENDSIVGRSPQVNLWILDVHATTREELSKSKSGSGPAPSIRRIPARLQRDIDSLIQQSKTSGLSETEQREFDEVMDYLDDLTIHELARASGRDSPT